MSNQSLPRIETLLPHRGTMLLLDEVLALSEAHAQVASHASIQSWYATETGAMPAWIGIELMAQAVAAHVGWCKMEKALPTAQGVLLGTRRYQADVSEFAGPLVIEAKLVLMGDDGMGAYECTIASPMQCLASAIVKVFEPKNFQEFLRAQLEGV
jgi:predicted hotdog family 3-hydroxylacyl-ACP dehydratase